LYCPSFFFWPLYCQSFFLPKDNKEVISSCRSKDRQYNDQKKNDRQYNDQKKKDRQYNGQKKNDRQYNDQKKNDIVLSDLRFVAFVYLVDILLPLYYLTFDL
jgi:hypothetical protein